MQTSLNWMNSYLSNAIQPDDVEEVLTAAGFEVDDVKDMDGDTLFDIEVTSNRSDCLSHLGMAREVAAASERTLNPPKFELSHSGVDGVVGDGSGVSGVGPKVSDLASVENQAPEVCPVYTARVIQGVKIAPSPDWLVERIESIGLRPINNVVDITNYVLHELGQPLHAFDLNLLDGKKIVVRHANDGEAFTAIDNTKHQLKSNMLVIADANKPVAVAGVMGGIDSEVNDNTVDILLESARFDPLSVRATSRALRLSSDSSYRFERKVDPAGVLAASDRATQLILELAGGTLAEGIISVGEDAPAPSKLSMRIDRCNQLLGVDVPVDVMLGIFSKLELQPEQNGNEIVCTIPTFRLDLTREVDLIEEIARLYGMDDEHLPVQDKMSLIVRKPQKSILARKAVNHVLTSHGFYETITFSNVPTDHVKPFAKDWEIVELNKEQKKSDPALRTSLIPSLLETRKGNRDAGNKNVRLFEIAHVFGKAGGVYQEGVRLGLLIDADNRELALRQLTGVLNDLTRSMGIADSINIQTVDDHAWADPGATLTHASDNAPVGEYGMLNAKLQKMFDLHTPVVVAEIDYTRLIEHYPPQPVVKTLPRFPAIERDLSAIVEESVTWSQIKTLIANTETQLMEELEFVTVYRGKQVGKGLKSVTFRMSFRDPERTLQHNEVDPQVNRVIEALKQDLNAEIRE